MAVGFKKTSCHLHLLPKNQRIQDPNQIDIPSWELAKSRTKALLKITFLSPRWDIYGILPWKVYNLYKNSSSPFFQAKRTVKPRCVAWADLRWCQKITASPGVSPGHLEGDSAEGETLELHKSCLASADGVLKDGRARGWGGKLEKKEDYSHLEYFLKINRYRYNKWRFCCEFIFKRHQIHFLGISHCHTHEDDTPARWMPLPCASACGRWRLATVRCCWMDALCCCWEWIVMRAIHMEGSTSLCSGLENERHVFFLEKFGFQDSGSSEKPTFFVIFHPFFRGS